MHSKRVVDEEEKLVQSSEMSIILNSYDDIFSDFDPRHFSQRALSQDFLPEIRRAAVDKPFGGFELRLLVPRNKRNLSHESVIKGRLKEHFKRHHDVSHREVRKVITTGVLMIVLGTVLGVIATSFYGKEDINFFFKFLIILMEPASWFNIWEGLNQIFFESKASKQELEFYEKMNKADISFHSY